MALENVEHSTTTLVVDLLAVARTVRAQKDAGAIVTVQMVTETLHLAIRADVLGKPVDSEGLRHAGVAGKLAVPARPGQVAVRGAVHTGLFTPGVSLAAIT